MNKNIDQIISQTKGMFTPIAIEYLRQTIKNEHRAMIRPDRMKRSQYSVKDIKKVIAQKKSVINSLNGSPSKYTGTEWIYLANVVYQIYLFHDPKKRAVRLHFLNDQLVSNRIIKAHYEYYFRRYLQDVNDYDSGLGLIHVSTKQIKDHLASFKLIHGVLL